MNFFVLAMLCPLASLFLIYRSGVYLAQTGSFWSLGLVSISLLLLNLPTDYWMKTNTNLAISGVMIWQAAFVLVFAFANIRTLHRDYKTKHNP